MSISTAKHTDMYEYAAAVARTQGNARAAVLVARQAARENWTDEAVETAAEFFGSRAKSAKFDRQPLKVFVSTYNKFRTDKTWTMAAGYSTQYGFYGNGFDEYDEGVMIVDNFKRGTRQSGPVFDSLKIWAATERLTEEVSRYGKYQRPFTYCENENCRANCCK